ncbi:MAG TPA: hypothetical protein VJY62_10645 [Bacteroidia bacterium]|nr:hypothetical protein [Bacteroidia bacterium]
MKAKPNYQKLFIAVIFLFAFTMNANAQINDAYARITESGQNFNCSFIVELSDTLNTSQIEVSLGTMPDSSDVIFKTFTFDAAPPSGCTYSRNLFTLTLGTGTLTEHRTYYANVRVNHSGNWTSYSFITN